MKYETEFPLFRTKVEGLDKTFDLSDIDSRREYFLAKADPEIEKLKKYIDEGKTFIVYLLGKKNAGKGTYTKLLMEIFGRDKIAHLSVGDLVRDVHAAMEDPKPRKKNFWIISTKIIAAQSPRSRRLTLFSDATRKRFCRTSSLWRW